MLYGYCHMQEGKPSYYSPKRAGESYCFLTSTHLAAAPALEGV